MYKAVILDVGGVILQIDWNRPFEFVGIYDPRRRHELVEKFHGWKHFHLFEKGLIGPDQFLAELGTEWGVERDPEILKEAWLSLVVGEVPGADAIFDLLKGRIPVTALSNTNVLHFAAQNQRFSILRRFDRFLTSCELHERKPDAAVYLAAAKLCGVEPNEVLFVDDSLANVEAARRVGFTAARTENSARETIEFLKAHLP